MLALMTSPQGPIKCSPPRYGIVATGCGSHTPSRPYTCRGRSVEYVRPRHRFGNWLGGAAHKIVHGKIDLHRRERIFHRRKRPQVNDECGEIIVGKVLKAHRASSETASCRHA